MAITSDFDPRGSAACSACGDVNRLSIAWCTVLNVVSRCFQRQKSRLRNPEKVKRSLHKVTTAPDAVEPVEPVELVNI